MKTTVNNLSKTKVELTINLGESELADAKQVAVKKLSHDLKVAGFRKGKVPYDVALKNIDPNELQEQIANDAISKAVAEAFIKEEIKALDRPAVTIKKFVPGESLEFTAEAEILPEIKLGDYKKLKVKKDIAKVSEAEMAEIINRLRTGLAEKKEVNRPAKNGDETLIDFVGKKDGVAFEGGTGKDYKLTLGSNQFIPGFEDGIVGHNKGDTFDLDLTFPADYGSADLAGSKVTFTVTLNSVLESILPELNDDLAVKAGPFKNVQELKADIERELTSQKERENIERLKDSLVSQLVEISNVPAPEILINDQVGHIEQDFQNNLMYQGLTLEQYMADKKFDTKEIWHEAEVRPIATKRVQAGLVLAELSKVEKVQASTAEVDARIDALKNQYAKNPEALKQLENPDIKRDIANSLLSEKTIDRLIELNTK